ncbi:Zinc finger CCCH domain-containing protein 63 [Apostasia shenzhenica]|uniref:Zinc finger CCCH domain-containing protein 63 n=1 Tax=Apostasia shenzhenica TaxID=1088818 RepID=A0A2I0AH48_9ASPA|nr:Zinc finger CCCH domain-containing protein 63 [Apostasia shenzhenica]
MDPAGCGEIQVHAPGPAASVVTEALATSSFAQPRDEESMWQINSRAGEIMDSGSYPERPGESDCAYYLRTGLCRFGMTCRFNHPSNRKLAVARMKDGYPERVGQPECQYYLKTGTCKFGPTCKFHHPKDKAGIEGRVQLNILGYPLRPNEKECPFYLRTGQCKFGNTCKFHHPQPSSTMLSFRGSSVYPSLHSTTPGQQSFTGGLTNWPMSRAASFIASHRWQVPSSYAQLILPQGLVQVPSWNTFSSQLGSVTSSENQQLNPMSAHYYGGSHQGETSAGSPGTFSYRSGSVSIGQYALQRENAFPERPGQPECLFYMKTGDCKFGEFCKFHHPRERIIPSPNCILSPLGLPLRPGEPVCIFYSRYGICKFGPNCKFDHPVTTPMGILAYNLSASSSPDVPVVHRLLGSSSGHHEAGAERSRDLSLSDSRQITSVDSGSESE